MYFPVEQPAKPVDEATPEKDPLETLRATVDDHGEAIEEIISWFEAQPGGPWVWHLLEEDAAAERWAQLGEWVRWLDDRYLRYVPASVGRVEGCWFHHPLAVEALTALWVSYLATYRTGAIKPSAALVEWHERSLWPTLDRLKHLRVFEDCSRTRHQLEVREPMLYSESEFVVDAGALHVAEPESDERDDVED